MRQYEKVRLIDLFHMLKEAMLVDNQIVINSVAYEIAIRMYVPGTGMVFEDLLHAYGYKNLDKTKQR